MKHEGYISRAVGRHWNAARETHAETFKEWERRQAEEARRQGRREQADEALGEKMEARYNDLLADLTEEQLAALEAHIAETEATIAEVFPQGHALLGLIGEYDANAREPYGQGWGWAGTAYWARHASPSGDLRLPPCEHCGESHLEPDYTVRRRPGRLRFHSKACKQAAYRERKKLEQRSETPLEKRAVTVSEDPS